MSFKLGDKVKWTSGAGGIDREKSGEIIQVVPEGKVPKTAELQRMELKFSGSGIRVRPHESYVVSVKCGPGQPRAYWPLVARLSMLEEPINDSSEKGVTPKDTVW